MKLALVGIDHDHVGLGRFEANTFPLSHWR